MVGREKIEEVRGWKELDVTSSCKSINKCYIACLSPGLHELKPASLLDIHC